MTDPRFERELESLIESNHTVLVCQHCDHIIGFLDYAPNESEFSVADLLFVAGREELRCQFCNSVAWSVLASSVLTTGRQATLPQEAQATIRMVQQAGKVPLYPAEASPNERFLDSVLRLLYPFKQTEQTDHILISECDVSRAADHLAALDKNKARTVKRMPAALYLRPVFNADHCNVLGSVWDTVKKMLGTNYPYMTRVAVGVLPQNELSASAHVGPGGESAIVLRLGLFQQLYQLNQLVLHLLGYLDTARFPQPLLIKKLHALLLSQESQFTDNPNVEDWSYKSDRELETVDVVSRVQQEFVILHELGHIQDWHAKCSDTEPVGYCRRAEESEWFADAWAVDLLIREGSRFHQPNAALLWIFWLFEYWHAISIALGTDATLIRARWDRIYGVLVRHGFRWSVNIAETRDLFDHILVKGNP